MKIKGKIEAIRKASGKSCEFLVTLLEQSYAADPMIVDMTLYNIRR